LGYLHSRQFGKTSLMCDLQELYRYLIDDCLIRLGKTLRKGDFRRVYFGYRNKRNKYPRLFLKKEKHRELERCLHDCFEFKTMIPRVKGKGHSKHQTIETLVNEEAMLLARFLRNEKKVWKSRIPSLP
jgi:CRISPR/Cas system-associated endonuclease Cas1